MKSMKLATERGQALIILALAAIGLFGIVGLAIDGGAKFSDRRHAQNAVDTAALAGSLARLRAEEDPTLTEADIKAAMELAALELANQNGYEGDLVTSQVWVYRCDDPARVAAPLDCGPYEGESKYIQVTIRSYINTSFARVIGIDQLQNTVRAVAMSQESYVGELYGGASIVGLAPDQCKTIWFSGSAETNISGGGVFSNSELDCGVTIQGSTDINMDGSIDMVASNYTLNGNPPLGDIAGGLHGPTDGYEYEPPAEMLPNPTCGADNAAKSGSSMTPGNWSGTFPPNGVDTLDAGLYCINGDFRLNAGDHLSGTGVTIFMQSGGINWNGGAEINLSAPTSGDLPGLLIYAPMSNTSTMRFNGNASTTLTGTIFMPAAPIIFNGTGNVVPSHVQIIGYTVEVTGSNITNVVYQDNDNWDATMPAQIGLLQ